MKERERDRIIFNIFHQNIFSVSAWIDLERINENKKKRKKQQFPKKNQFAILMKNNCVALLFNFCVYFCILKTQNEKITKQNFMI